MPDPTTSSTAAQVAAPTKSVAKKTFQELVDSPKFKEQIALALPKHITPERFIRVLMTAAIKTPDLMLCTQESLFKGLFDAATAGVEIDGRRAHLIPFKNRQKNCVEATLIIDYKGIAELAMRSGSVSSIHADKICENDIFEYDRGEIKKHNIDFKKERGEAYAYYTIIRMRDGGEKCEVMSRKEVNAIRQRSKAKDSGPWVTDFDAMALKTVFKRASKWIPLSAEIRNIVEEEDKGDEINVTKSATASLAGLIGAPGVSATEMDESGHLEKGSAEAGSQPAVEPAVEAKTYTPEQRKAALDAVQTAMLDCQVSEAKIMLYCHQNKLAGEGHDEVGVLPTNVLEALKTIVPTLKVLSQTDTKK